MTGVGSIKALAVDLDCHIRAMALYEVTIGMASICLRGDKPYFISIYLVCRIVYK